MCAILDTNVVSEVFGSDRPSAGKGFFDWINTGKGHLVVGGKLHEELTRGSDGFREWTREAQLAGRLWIVREGKLKERTEELCAEGTCSSNDPHIIALAQVSGVRRLYSNDKRLQDDFTYKGLIDKPRGKVYSTNENNHFSNSHKGLLRLKKNELCRIKR